MGTRAFDSSQRHRLDSGERQRYMPPFKTLRFLGLREKDIMVDIGCGTGFFTIPASEITGPGGKVYATDISDQMISELITRIDNKHSNIEISISDNNDIPFSDSLATFALLSNVLHEADDPEIMLLETFRILKPGGRLAVIEWEKSKMSQGPPLDHRLHHDKILSLVRRSGFVMPRILPAGMYHIACTARKKE